MKRCKVCMETKAAEKFLKDGRTADGLSPSCALCKGVAQDGDTAKRCTMCGETKKLAEFHRDLASPDGFRRICKVCGVRSARAWNKANPEQFKAHQKSWQSNHKQHVRERARKHHLLKTYNLTQEQFWALFDAQNGKCAICDRPAKTKNLHVDHDHNCCKGAQSCGKCIRGLLCAGCNGRLLPSVANNPNTLRSAADYLERPYVNLDEYS